MNEQNGRNFVNTRLFGIILSLIISVIIILSGVFQSSIASLNGKVENCDENMQALQGDIREIKTNVSWIMEALKEAKRQ